jgi:hypothetical protein
MDMPQFDRPLFDRWLSTRFLPGQVAVVTGAFPSAARFAPAKKLHFRNARDQTRPGRPGTSGDADELWLSDLVLDERRTPSADEAEGFALAANQRWHWQGELRLLAGRAGEMPVGFTKPSKAAYCLRLLGDASKLKLGDGVRVVLFEGGKAKSEQPLKVRSANAEQAVDLQTDQDGSAWIELFAPGPLLISSMARDPKKRKLRYASLSFDVAHPGQD